MQYHDDLLKTLQDLRDEIQAEADGVKEILAQGIAMSEDRYPYEYWVGQYKAYVNGSLAFIDNKIRNLTVKFQDDEDSEEGWSSMQEKETDK